VKSILAELTHPAWELNPGDYSEEVVVVASNEIVSSNFSRVSENNNCGALR
jgi:hypothetical protein